MFYVTVKLLVVSGGTEVQFKGSGYLMITLNLIQDVSHSNSFRGWVKCVPAHGISICLGGFRWRFNMAGLEDPREGSAEPKRSLKGT